MQSTATEFHDLHKSYDGQLVLRGPSFSFRARIVFLDELTQGLDPVARRGNVAAERARPRPGHHGRGVE